MNKRIGIMLMVVGAMVLLLSMALSGASLAAVPANTLPDPGPPSGNGIQPYVPNVQNPTCADLGLGTLIEVKVEPPDSGTYPLDSDGSVTITADGVYFDWTSTIGIDAVIVKGGEYGNAYVYDPPAEETSDTDLHSPINPQNQNPYGLSHIVFCYDTAPECEVDADCDDQDACTTDTCIDNTCQYTDVVCLDTYFCYSPVCDTELGCIQGPQDVFCDDQDICTDDSCDEDNNQCVNSTIPNCCITDDDCDDQDACTTDECIDNQCVNTPIANCCYTNADCDDQNACTTNECIDNRCVYTPECTEDADCTDDGDPCTAEYCDANGCCLQEYICECGDNEDCDDLNACTTDACIDNACQYTAVVCPDTDFCYSEVCDTQLGCIQGPQDVFCDDQVACTDDSCDEENNQCVNEPDDTVCYDDDICTDDYCDAAEGCVNEFDPTNDPSCEEVPPKLSAIASSNCDEWSCTLTSKPVEGDYSVKVVLDGDVIFEKSGNVLGTKKFEHGLALAGTGDHDIKVTCSVKVGDDVAKDVSEKTLHCGEGGPTPTPTPPPPPPPTPTPVSEVLGVEVLPTTGGVAPIVPSLPLLLRALGGLLLASGGLLHWLDRDRQP